MPDTLPYNATFPDRVVDEALNYCRDPNTDALGPWCYYTVIQNVTKMNEWGIVINTTQTIYKRGHCALPICAQSDIKNDVYKKLSHMSKMKTPSRVIADIIVLVLFPMLITIGTVTNFLSIAVFMNKKLRHSNSASVLIMLSLTDIVYLYIGAFPRWLRILTDEYIETGGNVSCQVYNFLMYCK